MSIRTRTGSLLRVGDYSSEFEGSEAVFLPSLQVRYWEQTRTYTVVSDYSQIEAEFLWTFRMCTAKCPLKFCISLRLSSSHNALLGITP